MKSNQSDNKNLKYLYEIYHNGNWVALTQMSIFNVIDDIKYDPNLSNDGVYRLCAAIIDSNVNMSNGIYSYNNLEALYRDKKLILQTTAQIKLQDIYVESHIRRIDLQLRLMEMYPNNKFDFDITADVASLNKLLVDYEFGDIDPKLVKSFVAKAKKMNQVLSSEVLKKLTSAGLR